MLLGHQLQYLYQLQLAPFHDFDLTLAVFFQAGASSLAASSWSEDHAWLHGLSGGAPSAKDFFCHIYSRDSHQEPLRARPKLF